MINKYNIYISYSRADYETARKIVGILQRQGYSCFVDFQSIGTSTFDEQIYDAINNSNCFLLLYSQQVESSQFVRREVEFALQNGIKFLPILLTNVEKISWYKNKFANVNCIRFDDGVLSSEANEKLVQSVRSILGEPKIMKQASSFESMPNCDPSNSDNARIPTVIPNYAPNDNAHKNKQSKQGYGIFFVILFAIIGFGLFFSNRFVDSYLPSDDDQKRYDSIVVESHAEAFRDIDMTNIDCMVGSGDVSEIDWTVWGLGFPDEDFVEDAEPDTIASEDCEIQPTFKGDRDYDNNPTEEVSAILYVNKYLWILIVLLLLVLGAYIIYKYQRHKRKNVKITCNKTAVISIDGDPIAELEEHKVLFTHLSKGKYIVDFQLISNNSKHKTIPINVSKVSEDIIVDGKFQSLLYERSFIKVFIAGSTRLVAERDALRSAISLMYNKYKEDNLFIEAYSFDDFPREFTEGGHQKLYDEFIRQEANWVVFITDGEMGEKTIWELENAINAYKSNKRPKILMFSKQEMTQSSLQMSCFSKLLLEENQYWIDYYSLDDIKTSFCDHLQWDLYNLMKRQYKKVN